jgi:hypothetical protein
VIRKPNRSIRIVAIAIFSRTSAVMSAEGQRRLGRRGFPQAARKRGSLPDRFGCAAAGRRSIASGRPVADAGSGMSRSLPSSKRVGMFPPVLERGGGRDATEPSDRLRKAPRG